MIYFGFKEIHIDFTATIRTSALSQFNLKGYRFEQIQKILKLRNEGFTDQQIADHFKIKNIKTPTGKKYTKQLVLMTRYKYKKRIERSKGYSVEVSPIIFKYIF